MAQQDTVRWQLDVPNTRALELDQFAKDYGFSTRKDLVNTALSFLQWAVDEVKTGRIIASVDEKNLRYKQLDLPAFKLAAAAAKPAAIVSVLQNELESFASAAPNSEDVRQKTEAVRHALGDLAIAAGM